MISSEDLRASKLSIDIIEWLEEFFSVEQGEGGIKEKRDVLFEESQIGYLPEGFKKTSEFINRASTYLKYENDLDDFVQILVGKDKTIIKFDNLEDVYEVLLNEAGYEYTAAFNNTTNTGALVWQDSKGTYYFITGTVEYEELIKVMNGISY